MSQHKKRVPRVCVIGTGALACLFGARLSQVADVTLIGTWQAQIDAINHNGMWVQELSGELSDYTLQARRYPFEPDADRVERADFALVLVKSFQTAAAAKRVRNCIKPNGVTLSLQNGLGNQEALLAELPFYMVSSGSTMQGAYLDPTRPGVVWHAGDGVSIIDDKPFLMPLKALLQAAGLPMQTFGESGANSIEAVLWRKLIINAAINPITALLGQTNGFIAADANARKLCIATAREAAAVAERDGSWPADQDAELVAIRVAEKTAPNRSSMLQDVSRGTGTEIEAICGEIVRRANRHGVEVPLNQLWLKLIQELENSGATLGRPVFSPSDLLKMIR